MLQQKLTIDEQIEYLKSKGITFNLYSEDKAKNYLTNNNSLFRLLSYRKNYNQSSNNMYINLDFAYLVDIATIDMHIRYALLQMCLDIEHVAKLKILQQISISEIEDGYSIVEYYK